MNKIKSSVRKREDEGLQDISRIYQTTDYKMRREINSKIYILL